MSSSSSDNENKRPALEVDDVCKVLWRDGQQELTARIVERRPLKAQNKRPKLDIQNAEDAEYYVHYVEHDRRLDEWITLDKFLLDTLQKKVVEEKKETTTNNNNAITTRASRTSISGQNQQQDDVITKLDGSFRLTGGNWHGSSGDPTLEQLEKEHEEITKVKNISRIIMGGYEVEAWYFSPYPKENTEQDLLYVCEYCLKYMSFAKSYKLHKCRCSIRRPPGTEIYRQDDLSVFEVDGKENPVYCQNLCLLAKLFLDHKTLYYDVDPFYFYVVTQVNQKGAHIVGYFSKEKVSAEDYNLACILTLPQYQQSGYGKFIISLSYELTKREGKTGSPEKPLSDLGKISYRSYWTHVLLHFLKDASKNAQKRKSLSMKDISQETGIKTEDILSTLQSLDMIQSWKGQHVIYIQQSVIDDYMKQGKRIRLCDSKCLQWEPPSQRKKT